MNTRFRGVPIIVLWDVAEGRNRCVNGLHIQTFIANPFGEGTLITFANGDTVTVSEDFHSVVNLFIADHTDG